MTPRTDRSAVVVGVDGTTVSLNAARWAGYLAGALRAPLSIVHVVPRPEPAGVSVRSRGARPDPDGIVEQTAELVRTSVDDLDIGFERGYGATDSTLVERSERARYLVVGMHTVLGTGLIGRTTMHLVTRAHCPVVVWRGTVGRPIPRRLAVAVGVDGTRLSDPAIGHAFELAAAFGVPVRAVHSWPPGIEPIGRHVGAQDAARALLSESVSDWRRKFPAVPVIESAVPGPAVPVLVRASAQAQLVVVGSRSRESAAAVFLGSTSRDLLHRARCPVLVCGDAAIE
ncbi:universal stress protein [Nocardia vaccinii]|uniref:universal stress protein n=1 Tax=Nocardia vaccinii TaxID=1822 RepID=UPI0014719166|nr:universal stress protein [Nocardia vaccinii]